MGLTKRRVKTASGATAVQIVRYRRGGREVVEHLGSAHDEASLSLLEARAAERINELIGGEQLVLDFGERSAAQSSGLAPVVQGSGSRARVLWEVLNGVYEQIGFNVVGSEVFRSLVIARLIRPTSKLNEYSLHWGPPVVCAGASRLTAR